MHRSKTIHPQLEHGPSQGDERISLWFAFGWPLITFCGFIMGLLFLHPWAGFLLGLGVGFLLAETALHRR